MPGRLRGVLATWVVSFARLAIVVATFFYHFVVVWTPNVCRTHRFNDYGW